MSTQSFGPSGLIFAVLMPLACIALLQSLSHQPEGAVRHGEPKYRTPNEFTMKDGCKVRSTQGAMWLYDRISKTTRWYYVASYHMNDWSDKCSKARLMYPEDEISQAKYR